MGMFITAFRIKLSGDIGGMIFMVLCAFAIAGIITGILGGIKDNLLGKESAVGKVISKIEGIVWIVTIILIVLDLTSIFPIYRTLLFALLDKF